jgi:HAD superfamily hydrolase (TIGR01509 family)
MIEPRSLLDPVRPRPASAGSPPASVQPPVSLEAALWDFDGTLADTEGLWIDAEFELVAELGGTWNASHADHLLGRSLMESGSYILDVIGRPDVEPAWVVDQLVNYVIVRLRSRPIPWRPGALELLDSFRAAGVPCALVSASYRVLLEAALGQLPGGTFAVSVAGDEVTHGKPHPEPYERACAALGVQAENCVVFEDSVTGARSGNAAGALVVAIPHRVDVPTAPRRVVIPSLVGLDADGVTELLQRADDFV